MKRTVQRIVAIVLVAAATSWLAALFGFASGFLSDDPPAVNPYATGSTTTTTEAGPVIAIVGFAFGGDDTAAVGDQVIVSNQSSSSHTWTDRDGSFASGSIPAGGSFAFVFETAGTYEFFCEFHPGMAGSITVGD